VRRLAAEAGETPGDDALPESTLALLFLRALQAMADRQYSAAEQLLKEATAIQEIMPHTLFVGSARLWLAYLYEQWQRPEEALSLLETLLAECQQAGTPGLILREGPLFAPLLEKMAARKRKSALVSLLLDALSKAGKPRPVAVPGTAEKLSPREVEVLRLLASGASNQEIALQLVVTVSTAKAHVSNILAKLDVSSRSAAVARARELRLI